MTKYVAPSVETLEKHNLWPFVLRGLGLIHAVTQFRDGWLINDTHIVMWDGAGFVCDCENWQRYHQEQDGFCKHSLAVCLQSDSYRGRIIAALEKKEVCCEISN